VRLLRLIVLKNDNFHLFVPNHFNLFILLNDGKSYNYYTSSEQIAMIKRMPKLNKKAFSIGSIKDESEEKKFWLSKKPIERLQAIEINRRMIYGENRIASRLQRLLKTSSLSQS
jgi:hypothetical protein